MKLWLDEDSTRRLADGVVISANIPDPNEDKDLYDLVMKYQIHKCKTDVCQLI